MCAQMLMDAIERGVCTDTVKESALKFDSGREIPCRTGESNLRQRHAGPTIYQLSYIPIPSDIYILIPLLTTSFFFILPVLAN